MDDIPEKKGLNHASVVVDGLKLYMCGGYVSFQEAAIATSAAATLRSTTHPDSLLPSQNTFVVDRYVGGDPGPQTDLCYFYDHSVAPGNGQWKALPKLPFGRSGGGLFKDKALNMLIFAGGAERPVGGNTKDFPQTWKLPLTADGKAAAVTQWQPTTDTPLLSNHMSFVTAVDNVGKEHHYVMGGQKGGNEGNGNFNDIYEFDPVTAVWTQRQDMPLTRGHATASTRAVSCGFIIIAGTSNAIGKIKDISYYDIPTNTWTKVGELSTAINSPVCDIDFKNKVLYCETGNPGTKFSKKISIEL
jgi:Kelch motif